MRSWQGGAPGLGLGGPPNASMERSLPRGTTSAPSTLIPLAWAPFVLLMCRELGCFPREGEERGMELANTTGTVTE